MTKGMFSTNINMDKSQPHLACTNNEMPVTPPSKNWLGSKKPFNPTLANTTASDNSKASLIWLNQDNFAKYFCMHKSLN